MVRGAGEKETNLEHFGVAQSVLSEADAALITTCRLHDVAFVDVPKVLDACNAAATTFIDVKVVCVRACVITAVDGRI